jgi:Na+/H+ antiporter NhaC
MTLCFLSEIGILKLVTNTKISQNKVDNDRMKMPIKSYFLFIFIISFIYIIIFYVLDYSSEPSQIENI